MRIIAGEFRGRKLLAPESLVTRPITDRVKQSLFDILTPLLPGARVYDLFAGTGSLGLEALSRGAKHATFFEADRSALARLRRNIETLTVQARSRIVAGDVFRHFQSAGGELGSLGVVFLDPPYRYLREDPEDLRSLASALASLLAPDGLLVFRHDSADHLALRPLISADVREYGSMTVELLRRQTALPAPVI